MSDLHQSFVHVTYGRDLVGLRSGCLFQASIIYILKTVRGGSRGDDYGDPPVAAAYFMLLLCV